MKLSIIIPTYNEEENIEKVIASVRKAPVQVAKEIIIVDDGSVDKTPQILAQYKKDKDIKIVLNKENKGKGASVREGIREAMGDVILIQDADLEYEVNDYPKILEPILKKKATVVYGSRFLGKISGMRWQNRLANRILTLAANFLYGIKITDEATAYKAFKADVLKSIPLKCQRFEFCPEVTAKLAKKRIKITEVPITYHARTNFQGKKIGWQDGFEALWTLIKYRFKN